MKRRATIILFYAIFLLAAVLRLYMVNWDGGFHMHPDERAITLTVIKLTLPTSLQQFLSPESPWNTKFFAYGSFPFYLLYLLGLIMSHHTPAFGTYDGINILGRYLSALFDLGTLILVFMIGRKLLSPAYALIGMFFYAVSVLPIQLSHFYAVDTPLTFFITGTLYFLLSYYETLAKKYLVPIGMFFGAALATKISASVVTVSIGAALVADYLLLVLRQPHKPKQYVPHLPLFLRRLITHAAIICLVTGGTFLFLEPYALIDYPTFQDQTLLQSEMTKSAFTFPYTLQYVGKIPYVYEFKNLFLFGQGPLLAFITLVGILLFTIHALLKTKHGPWAKEFILVSFFWVYFLIVGSFAIGFMRYMLPVYPLLCLAGAFLIEQSVQRLPHLRHRLLNRIGLTGGAILLLIWPVSFLTVYAQPNTRIQADSWIHHNIPAGKTLAIEHWDDALPLTEQSRYTMLTLPLYDPDTPEKWESIRLQLVQADYIILASNRLYTPLMKLTDCDSLPPGRCYPQTASYYQKLFSGELGFTKVADITSYPHIPLTNISFNDQRADESFTVYDHPRILIFKKSSPQLP